MNTYIINAKVFSKGKIIENKVISIKETKINQIINKEDYCSNSEDIVIDFNGDFLVPGFIDMHIHGLKQYLVDKGRDDIEKISQILPEFGTTGFLPTILPHSEKEEEKYFTNAKKSESVGAEVLGFFCEGPFIALTGAIRPDALKDKSLNRMYKIRDGLSPIKVIFAVSPEIDDAENLISHMEQPVFITHTAATYDQTCKAIEKGINHATHFYNVFPCPQETDGGVRPVAAVEAVLADSRVSVDFILDGEHVNPGAVKMAIKCKGIEGVSLITDSNIGASFPPGRYLGFGDDEVEFAYQGGPARGTENSLSPHGLYGSGLTMNLAVKNVIKFKVGSLSDAVTMASTNPAKTLNLYGVKGDILPGFDADIVRLNPELEVIETWIKGKSKYKKER